MRDSARKNDLLERIYAFPLDDPTAERPFSLRLMQENAWSKELAQKVVQEYRRFVFLCMVADHACVPSSFVDQVWHMHILYLDSYLLDFCIKVLGRILWHRPSKGGTREHERHHQLYCRTLETYQLCFGEAPPSDVWGRCNHLRHHEGKATGVGEPAPAALDALLFQTGS